jgi:hypothetical protein
MSLDCCAAASRPKTQFVRRLAYLLSLVCLVVWVASASGAVTSGSDRVVRFTDLPRGWVWGIPRDVRPKSRIVGVFAGHRVAAGPTRNGNFCLAVSLGSRGMGGCVVRNGRGQRHGGELRPYLLSMMSMSNRRGTAEVLIFGSAFAKPGQRLVLVYADGTRERVSLTFVSRPIGAAFYLRVIPRAHQTARTRLRFLELRRGSTLVARLRVASPISPP